MTPGSFLLLALLGTPACMEQAPVRIVEPGFGAMISGSGAVKVTVEGDADEVLVNGKPAAGTGPFSATVPAADGLGFVVARVPGEELAAVRSWHQGALRGGRDWHPNNLALQLGERALATGQVSVASIIAELLQNEQLAPFVNNPLKITVATVPITINVTSVKTTKVVVVALKLDARGLHFLGRLSDVKVAYTARAVSVFNASGIAHFREIQVVGDMSLTPGKVELTRITTQATRPVIQDLGGLPVSYAQPLLGLLDADVTRAVADAAARAAQRVFLHLLTEIRPTVGLSFPRAITQTTTLDRVAVVRPVVVMWYKLLIQALAPRVARENQYVVTRPLGSLAVPASGGLGAYCGSGMFNQFAFAVWDAGNLEGISFTRQQLEQLGMEQLSFPYSQLDRATIKLHLPPLLAWGADGPRLAIGGVEARVEVSASDDITAWTAASVPVKLVQVANGLRLVPDPSRKVGVAQVGFDQMSELADQGKVLRILDTAVPGVISSVFGGLPTIELPTLQIKRLDGSKGPLLAPALTSVVVKADHWQAELELRKK